MYNFAVDGRQKVGKKSFCKSWQVSLTTVVRYEQTGFPGVFYIFGRILSVVTVGGILGRPSLLDRLTSVASCVFSSVTSGEILWEILVRAKSKGCERVVFEPECEARVAVKYLATSVKSGDQSMLSEGTRNICKLA